jgi:hypothetical protein
MDTSTKQQVEWGVYCENLVMIGLTAHAGDKFENRAPIPLTPCMFMFDCSALMTPQKATNGQLAYTFVIRILSTSQHTLSAVTRYQSRGSVYNHRAAVKLSQDP